MQDVNSCAAQLAILSLREEGFVWLLVSELSACGQPDLLFLGPGEAVLMTQKTEWGQREREGGDCR